MIRGARRAQSLSALLAAALAVVAVIVLPGVALAQSMTATLDTNDLVQYQTAVLRIEVTDPPENAEIAFGGDPEERGFLLSYRASQRFERGRQRIVRIDPQHGPFGQRLESLARFQHRQGAKQPTGIDEILGHGWWAYAGCFRVSTRM